jgi:WD40 repeat protein
VKVWDVPTGQEIHSLKKPIGYFGIVLAFSPDGQRLASGSKVWDAQNGQELLTLQGGGLGVAFSPDGKRLAGAETDQMVRVWDAQTGQELFSLKANGYCQKVAFSPDGKRLASAGKAGFKVWDAQTGQDLLTLKGYGTTFSPEGHRLAVFASDGTVKIYDATPLPGKP